MRFIWPLKQSKQQRVYALPLPLHHGLNSRWKLIWSFSSKMRPSGDIINTDSWYWPTIASAGLCSVSRISSCTSCWLNHHLSPTPRSFWTLITTMSLLPEEIWDEKRLVKCKRIVVWSIQYFLLFIWVSITKSPVEAEQIFFLKNYFLWISRLWNN